MTTTSLQTDIAGDEGLRLTAYPDPLTHAAPWTIGYGHTGLDVHPGLVWTQAQADTALAEDILTVEQELDHSLPWWRQLDGVRQDVLVNMCFNMGIGTLLTFRITLAAVERGDYHSASADMLLSAWAKEVGDRATRLAEKMRLGVP